MSSLLENYIESQNLVNDSDYRNLVKLYKSSKNYQENYNFDEFIEYATKNNNRKFDKSLAKYKISTVSSRPDFGSLIGQSLISNADSQIALSNMTKEEVAEIMPLKNVRRTFGGIINTLGTGTTSLVGDAMSPIMPFEDLGEGQFKIKTKKEIVAEENERKRKTQSVFSSVLRPVLTLGTDDIYDGDEIQRPEGLTGRLVTDFGSFIAAMKNPKQAVDIVKKFGSKKAKTTPKKVEIKSKNFKTFGTEYKQARNALILSQKKKAALLGLAKAEYASQVVFADDPELQFVAGWLDNKLGSFADDNLLGDVLEYLDTDETSTSNQRRMSLLFDGGAFLGILKSAGFIGTKGKKYSSLTVQKTLEEIKKDPKRREALKKYLKDPIQKVVPSFRSTIKDDVFVKTSDSGILKTPLNFLRSVRRKFGTSRGYYSEEMFNILKSAGYDKIAWSKSAENIFNQLRYQIKQISQTGKYTADEVEIMLGKYLGGDVNALKGTNKEFQEQALGVRQLIDELSFRLTKTKAIPQDLKNIIRLNYGSYLRQSYELFENPNWRPSDDVILKAKEYVSELLQGNVLQKQLFDDVQKLTPAEAQVKASNIVDDILSKGVRNKGIDTDVVKHFNDVFGVQKANIIFATKENIGKPLQDLMGRRGLTDTNKSVFNTIETLSHYLTEVNMYDDLFKRGEGKWFFKNGINTLDNNPQRVAGTIKGEGFGPLDNISTTPQIEKLFDKMNKIQRSDWWARVGQTFLGAKGWGQASATVYSLTTHARNTIGGGLIMLSNGLNPFDKQTRDSFNILKNEIFAVRTGVNKELLDKYIDYQKLGVVNQSVQASEMKRNIQSAAYLDDYIQSTQNKFSQVYIKPLDIVKKATQKTTKVYVAEDDLWRIAAFEKELAVLKKANQLNKVEKTETQLRQEAANIVRNTMPTYDLVPEGFQQLRGLPFGNFYSFFAERWRNSYHSLMQGVKEVNSGNAELIERGYQRLASHIAVGYAGGKGVNEFSKYAFGISDEEEKAIKDVALPWWSKNSTLGYQRDKNGNIQWVDLSFTDPQAPIIDVFKNGLDEFLNPDTPASTTSDKLAAGMLSSLITLTKPFMTEALFTERLLEAYNGRDNQTGKYIDGYLPTNSSFDNTMAIIYHTGNVLVPRFAREGFSYTLGEKAEKLKEGDLKFNNELLSKVTGQKFYSVTPESVEKNLVFRIRDFNKDTKNIKTAFSIDNNDTNEDILNKYLQQNQNYYASQVDLNKAINAAYTLNLDSLTINNVIKNNLSDFNEIEKQSFILQDSYFKPFKVSKFDLNKIFKLNDMPDIDYLEVTEGIGNLYLKLSHLPLIEKNKYSKQEKEILEMVNPPLKLRKQYFKGEQVSKDFPVTDVKETAADRVNPFTGEPYSDQMARLGFDDGGRAEFLASLQSPKDNVPEEEIILYDEDQGLKPVLPVIELLVGGAGRILAPITRRGADAVEETIRQKYRTFKIPKEVYHGGPKTLTDDVIKSQADLVNANQAAIFTTRIKKAAKDYAEGKNGNVYKIDTLKNINAKIFNPTKIDKSFKTTVNNEIKKNKNIINQADNTSIIGSRDVNIANKNIKDLNNLLRLDKLPKPKDSSIITKGNYVSRVSPYQRDILTKGGYDVIDDSNVGSVLFLNQVKPN